MTIPTTRRQALIGAGAALSATALGGIGGAYSQNATVLRLGHVLGPTHQFHTGLELAAESLAETAGGRVELQVFPAAQLDSERDMNVAIRTGGIDMVLASPGGASVHLKELAILDAPYLFRDNAHWQSVVYGDIGRDWAQRILETSGV